MDDNETLEFTAEVDVRPEITVPDYSDLAAEVDDTEVSDDDVQEQIEALRERFGTLADVERAAADGDFVVIDLVATKDGEPGRGRRGHRHVLPGRPRRHARGSRRGAGRDERRRRHDVHLAARGRRPGRRGRRGPGQGLPGPGPGAPRGRRRVRAARLGVRHRRGADRRRPQPARQRQAPRAGRCRPRRRPREAARAWSRCRCPRASSPTSSTSAARASSSSSPTPA